MQESNRVKLRSYVCVYLVLEREGKVLLSLRENTGYEDGKWSLVAGHAEEGETARDAMIREAMEETNITIKPEDLEFAYVMDRKSPNRQNIDIFFKCLKYEGELRNNEPDKCGGLKFFDNTDLPENIVNYIKVALTDIATGRFFREYN